jgi:hypothetical protein
MYKGFKIYVIALILIISGGNLWCFDEQFEFKLKLQEKYKPGKNWNFLHFDQRFVLSNLTADSFIKMGVCLKVRDNKVLVVDSLENKLLVFSKKGSFLHKIGTKGKGPGDLYHPGWFDIFDNRIYIRSNNGIDVFDYSDYSFLKRIRTFLSANRFIVSKDNIYGVVWGPYQGKYQQILQFDRNGTVQKEFRNKSFEKNPIRFDKRGSVLLYGDHLIFIPLHQNMIYFYHENGKPLKEQKINYPFLDDMETWNTRFKDNLKEKAVRRWYSNIFVSGKVFQGDLYLQLKIPRLEILKISADGNVTTHFYNDDDFRYMRWYDFDIAEEEGKLVFYLLGFSEGEEKKDLSDFGVYRVVAPMKTPISGKSLKGNREKN